MKVHKLTVLVIDHDGLDAGGVTSALECTNYANDCISPQVMDCETRDIGEWEDTNPLNYGSTWRDEAARLFATPSPGAAGGGR